MQNGVMRKLLQGLAISFPRSHYDDSRSRTMVTLHNK